MRFGTPTQAARVQSMVSHKIFFFFFFHSSDCVCRHNPVAPAATVAATRWRHDEHRGGSMGSSTPLHDTQLPDSDTMSSTAAVAAAVQRAGGGGEAGSTTARHDTQPPDGNTTGSMQAAAAAAMWAAPQRGTTRNRP